jgi:hypothetical protein
MSRLPYLPVLTIVTAATAWTLPAQDASPGAEGSTIARFDASFSDPGDAMAKSLATTEQVSLAEAKQRLLRQHEASVLSHKLRSIYRERFAGAMIERTAPFAAKFYFVGVDLAKVREALPGLGVSAALHPFVRLERAAQTEAEMQATADKMTQQLHARGIDGSVAWSVPMGGYTILSKNPQKAAEAVRMGYVREGKILAVEHFEGILLN